MATPAKKQSFLGGAAILTAAVLIVKLIGAFYKLPLNNILGDVGKTYFQTAYEIYNVLIAVSTAGLPLAISKLTSQAQAQGRENEKRKLFRVAVCLFFVLGLIASGLMFFGADRLAVLQNNEMAALPIRALAPSMFCVCLLSCFRGYTQGQGNMKPTAVSQVLEAACKLGIGLPLAWYVLHIGKALNVGAAGAIFGVTMGTVFSLFYLTTYMFRHRERVDSLDIPPSSGILMKQILAIGVPITLGNSAMSILTMIDTKIVLGCLRNSLGLSEVAAAALKGQYSYAMDMLNMVSSFVHPVTMSLIPFAAAALAQKNSKKAKQIIDTAFRLVALLALPAGVGLSVLSTPIMILVLPARLEGAIAAGPHLRVLGIATVFVCLMILTNAILQTYGHVTLPVFTMIIGGLVKITMNYMLVSNPNINIHGAPISTLCCYLTVVVINMFFVWKYSPEKPHYFQLFAKPVIASALMGGTAWSVYGFISRYLSSMSVFKANALSTFCAIVAAVIVYFVLVILLRILRAEDVESLPKGEKIAKVLHLK